MKKTLFIFVLGFVMLVLVACAPGQATQVTIPAINIQFNSPGPNPLVNTPGPSGKVAEILPGLVHGIISPVTLVLSFANPGVQMYEVHNDGSQYNLGFLLGVALVFMLLGTFVGSRR
ncbi:MAG TPA: hypothetical protein VGK00_08835 [Anaerolineales bacterium]|jgi:hypothetical protein